MFQELDEKPKRKRRSMGERIDLPRVYAVRSQTRGHRSPVFFTETRVGSKEEAQALHPRAMVALMGTHETLAQTKIRLGWA